MRVMNDNLIVELSIICTTGATLWLSFAKFLSPGREFLPEVSKVEIFLKTLTGFDPISFTEDSGRESWLDV